MNTNLGVISALACALALTMTACSGSDEPAATPTPTASGSPAPELIEYAKGNKPGVEVQSSAEAGELQGAPAALQDFIGQLADQLAEESTCTGGYVGVTVQTVRTDGFARGGVNDCGGYAALWADVDGAWQEVAGTQDVWDCDDLEKYDMPSDVAGDECYDAKSNKVLSYQQD